ncbi:MAG: hypothetical protein PF439_08985 [Helicobacteraceae bacterium]|jgi:hypothetical protein|nr:hypothetical protein [Helicobacteraceae bacterium]
MKRMTIGLMAVVLLALLGCSGGGNSTLLVAYNTVYGINALSTDENISLYVGNEVIAPVPPYDQNASVIVKAVGSNNIASYTVTGGNELGQTSLQNSKTYFYAATDCNVSNATIEALYHQVATDTQINIVNTSSKAFLTDDINISVDGVQVNPGSTTECVITAVSMLSAKDQNISVSFAGGSFAVWKILPSDISADIVIYGTPPIEAAIIPLPRLTSDAL